MKKIILLTDFSWNADHAMEYVLQWFNAKAFHGSKEFILLHVAPASPAVPTYPFLTSMVSSEDLILEETEQLHAVTEHFRAKFPQHQFREILAVGRLVEVVANLVKQELPHLLVMGTMGHSGLTRMCMGSSDQELLSHIRCPMLVVPAGAAPVLPKKMVIGTDLQLSNQMAVLLPLRELVNAQDPELQVVRVVTHNTRITPEDDLTVRRLKTYLKSRRFHFTNVEHVSAEDGLEDFIQSNGGDLIVLIGQERGFLENLFHHSVTKEIIIHASVPVMVLHSSEWEVSGERAVHDHAPNLATIQEDARSFIE